MFEAVGGRPAVLVIAATDSSAGAGITRDIQVLADFAVDALCAITAVTAQSDSRVAAIHHVPPDVIRAQVTAAFETRRVGAVKIGMLGTLATV
jgi:hydroxymethylpyrimidine/phosphomethylpyrimidine kinase